VQRVEEHRLSLQPLADAYAQAYGSTTGTLLVQIGDFELPWTLDQSL
jgi:hypothetical protein